MIEIIKAEFKQGLKNNPWLDKNAKKHATEKIGNMDYHVGHSSLYFNNDFEQIIRNVR
jgi:predicted metalloendopeptidase